MDSPHPGHDAHSTVMPLAAHRSGQWQERFYLPILPTSDIAWSSSQALKGHTEVLSCTKAIASRSCTKGGGFGGEHQG